MGITGISIPRDFCELQIDDLCEILSTMSETKKTICVTLKRLII